MPAQEQKYNTNKNRQTRNTKTKQKNRATERKRQNKLNIWTKTRPLKTFDDDDNTVASMAKI